MRELLPSYTVEFNTGRELDNYIKMLNAQRETTEYYINVTDSNKLKITVRVEV